MSKDNTYNKSRRDFLKKSAVAIASATFVSSLPAPLMAKAKVYYPPDYWYGMLYDATKCIGCKSCVVACKQVNGLPPELDKEGIYDKAVDLSSKTRTIIKAYVSKDSKISSFVKRQCMHCVDPACVSACPVKAMNKDDKTGIVYWRGDRCIGCRYCMVACPFEIPKFEWDKPFPKIVKCDLCRNTYLKSHGITACADVCPAGAIIFGYRNELLEEAKNRIKKEPERYYPEVYGEKEAGGTGVLYLTGRIVSFKDLGLPSVSDESPAEYSESIHHGIYHTLVPPFLTVGALYFLLRRNNKE